MQISDSFGIMMIPAESIWFREIESSLFRVNVESVSESFGIRSDWVREEFCKSIPNQSALFRNSFRMSSINYARAYV